MWEEIVGSDEAELFRGEEELVRDDVGSLLNGPGDVAIGPEITVAVFRAQLDALVVGFLVVEPAGDQGGPELAVVEQVRGDLLVGVAAELYALAVPLHLVRPLDEQSTRP